MIEQIYNYFTIEMLYYWVNLGVLPFWLILIFIPQSYISRFFVTSIFPIFILSGVYIFVIYKSYLSSYDFFGNFNLYLGLGNLSVLFVDNFYLMVYQLYHTNYPQVVAFPPLPKMGLVAKPDEMLLL